jgi:hypothetical protein
MKATQLNTRVEALRAARIAARKAGVTGQPVNVTRFLDTLAAFVQNEVDARIAAHHDRLDKGYLF